ncbi:MAG: hypothetical protein AAF108_09575 [Planctomycetota bacterium]
MPPKQRSGRTVARKSADYAPGSDPAGATPAAGAVMHFENHQAVIDDLEARILTIRDSL